jgi:glycerophosphoryl diester phosphodiesterase
VNGSTPEVFRSGRPLVFAHRGGAKLAPENTIAAFDRGLALGADGLELDVHLSREGIPVVIHDATLDRTTDRTGPVQALTAGELAQVDAGFRFGEERGHPFRGQGHGIPTLASVLARYGDARLVIEVKDPTPEAGRAVARLVREHAAASRVCVGSYHTSAIGAVRSSAPEIPTSASMPEARWTLHRSWVVWPFIGRRPYAAFQVPERNGRLRVVTPRFVRQVHREGQVLQVWVVDTPHDARRLLDWGVDGLITDRPDLIVSARDEWSARTR